MLVARPARMRVVPVVVMTLLTLLSLLATVGCCRPQRMTLRHRHKKAENKGPLESQITYPENKGLLESHVTHINEDYRFSWKAPGKDLGACPAWIKDFVTFQKLTRGKPGAKYIVNACLTSWDCHHGVGDRFRGLLATFQLAKAHNRVLLIAWQKPHPLEAFLEPAAINWMVTPDLKLSVEQAVMLPDNATLTSAGPPEIAAESVWRIDTNRMPYKVDVPKPRGVTWFKQVSWESHCIFQLLFKPTAELTRATDQVQRQLLGNLDKPFVALHLRLGNQEGESKVIDRGWDMFQGVMASYRCAVERDALLHNDMGFTEEHAINITAPAAVPKRNTATASRPTRPRMIMLTDHQDLRGMVAKGMLHGITGPAYVAHHFSYSKQLQDAETSRDVEMTIFADMMLLARARCLIWSRSGFSKFSMAYGWPSCTIQMENCIDKL